MEEQPHTFSETLHILYNSCYNFLVGWGPEGGCGVADGRGYEVAGQGRRQRDYVGGDGVVTAQVNGQAQR